MAPILQPIDILRDQYLAKYPNEEDPYHHLVAFGETELAKILAEANGRRIEFTYTENPDECDFKYV
jgi:hypothetical protein